MTSLTINPCYGLTNLRDEHPEVVDVSVDPVGSELSNGQIKFAGSTVRIFLK